MLRLRRGILAVAILSGGVFGAGNWVLSDDALDDCPRQGESRVAARMREAQRDGKRSFERLVDEVDRRLDALPGWKASARNPGDRPCGR